MFYSHASSQDEDHEAQVLYQVSDARDKLLQQLSTQRDPIKMLQAPGISAIPGGSEQQWRSYGTLGANTHAARSPPRDDEPSHHAAHLNEQHVRQLLAQALAGHQEWGAPQDEGSTYRTNTMQQQGQQQQPQPARQHVQHTVQMDASSSYASAPPNKRALMPVPASAAKQQKLRPPMRIQASPMHVSSQQALHQAPSHGPIASHRPTAGAQTGPAAAAAPAGLVSHAADGVLAYAHADPQAHTSLHELLGWQSQPTGVNDPAKPAAPAASSFARKPVSITKAQSSTFAAAKTRIAITLPSRSVAASSPASATASSALSAVAAVAVHTRPASLEALLQAPVQAKAQPAVQPNLKQQQQQQQRWQLSQSKLHDASVSSHQQSRNITAGGVPLTGAARDPNQHALDCSNPAAIGGVRMASSSHSQLPKTPLLAQGAPPFGAKIFTLTAGGRTTAAAEKVSSAAAGSHPVAGSGGIAAHLEPSANTPLPACSITPNTTASIQNEPSIRTTTLAPAPHSTLLPTSLHALLGEDYPAAITPIPRADACSGSSTAAKNHQYQQQKEQQRASSSRLLQPRSMSKTPGVLHPRLDLAAALGLASPCTTPHLKGSHGSFASGSTHISRHAAHTSGEKSYMGKAMGADPMSLLHESRSQHAALVAQLPPPSMERAWGSQSRRGGRAVGLGLQGRLQQALAEARDCQERMQLHLSFAGGSWGGTGAHASSTPVRAALDLPPPLRVRVLHSGHEAHLLRCVCQTLDKPYSTSVMSNHGSGSSVAGTGPHADGRLLGAATIVGQDARAAGAAAAAGMEGHALRCHPPSPLACVSLANAWPERVVVLLDTKRSMYMVGSAGIEEGSCVCLHSYRCMGGGTGLLLALLWSHEV